MNIKKGNPLQKGSTKQKDGYNFAIASAAEIIDHSIDILQLRQILVAFASDHRV